MQSVKAGRNTFVACLAETVCLSRLLLLLILRLCLQAKFALPGERGQWLELCLRVLTIAPGILN